MKKISIFTAANFIRNFVLIGSLAGWNFAHAASLSAVDVSILYPLKSSIAVDSIFGKSGDGMCNAPGIFEGQLPAVTQPVFESFAKTVFGRSGNLCDSEGNPDALFSSDSELMSGELQLARERGLPPEACDAKNWKVVSFRYDSCRDRKGKVLKSKQELLACVREARLVAQPFVRVGNQWQALDFSMHLIYSVPNADLIVEDLKKLSAVKAKVIKTKPWDQDDSQQFLLKAHPALRAEMDTCGGEFSTSLKGFFQKHTNHKLLTQMAWMTSSHAVQEWTFGAVGVKNGVVTPLKNAGLGVHDNFSNSSFISGNEFPFNSALLTGKMPSGAPQIGPWFTSEFVLNPAEKFDAATTTSARAKFGQFNDLMNPLKVGQVDTTCFSCHMGDQTFRTLARKSGVANAVGPQPYPAPPSWKHVPGVRRTLLNFHNFGYAPGFELGISQRTINETDDTLKLINAFHP